MNLTRRSLFASAVALLALPRRVAAERLLGPVPSAASQTAVTDAVRRIFDGLPRPTAPWFIVTPKTPDDTETARRVQSFLNAQFANSREFRNQVFDELLTRGNW